MSRQLVSTLQKLVAQTNNAMKPTDYCLGVVETVDPLSIRIDQKDILTEEFLILTDLVRDFSVDITVSHTTENRAGGGGYAEFASHNHDYTGRKKIIVHNGLSVGESVILIQQAGGQEFIVLSRLYDHSNVTGQWG